MRCVVVNFLLVSIVQLHAAAQGPNPNRCPGVEKQYQQLLWSGAVQSQVATQLTKRREAQDKERQFLMKAEKRVQSWTALAHEYNEKGTFNVKKAGEVSEAFHDLEKTEGWPRSDHW
jgi:RNA polymerase-interacting CarD/CdnL/TRCF family regulator